MLIQECEWQFEYWKETVTEEQAAQGMRDYEKARRDANFRQQEMRKMKEEFAKVQGLELNQFDTAAHNRIDAAQYK